MNKIYTADLVIPMVAYRYASGCFPLGVGCVTSYAKKVFGDQLDFEVFKDPEELSQAIIDEPPLVLAMSNYSWNIQTALKLSSWAKRHYPKLIIVFGGPNFPIISKEKEEFLNSHSVIDFYIEHEGEIGFSELLGQLQEHNFDAEALKRTRATIANCSYLSGDSLVEYKGEKRIQDLNTLPSPYLSGVLDKFFKDPYIPMMETNRGCPFSCTFCADGLSSKNRVSRFDRQRVIDELEYIEERSNKVKDLLVTDLNFGMYEQDLQTAKDIVDIQNKRGWPGYIRANVGKNKPERIVEVATILKKSFTPGFGIQSYDQEVLKNVKRSNISTEVYLDAQDKCEAEKIDDKVENSKILTQIILGLPGDTLKKHFETLRVVINNPSGFAQVYQAILLIGTEMASQETRDKFRLITKFRVIPSSTYVYQFGDEQVPITNIEEIIVGSNVMPLEDYLSCRVMHLISMFFYNNSLFEELFLALQSHGITPFEILEVIYEHDELYTPKVKEILERFKEGAMDLYDTHEEAEAFALSKEGIRQHLSEEKGYNELTRGLGELWHEIEDSLGILMQSSKLCLEEKGLLNATTKDYFDQLGEFLLCMKKNIDSTDTEVVRSFNYDFKTIQEAKFKVSPEEIQRFDEAMPVKFFHTPAQKERIRNAIDKHRRHAKHPKDMLYEGAIPEMLKSWNREVVEVDREVVEVA